MIIYVVFGDINYDGEYFEGVFSTFEEAKNRADSLPDYYDSVIIRDSEIDNPGYESKERYVR